MSTESGRRKCHNFSLWGRGEDVAVVALLTIAISSSWSPYVASTHAMTYYLHSNNSYFNTLTHIFA